MHRRLLIAIALVLALGLVALVAFGCGASQETAGTTPGTEPTTTAAASPTTTTTASGVTATTLMTLTASELEPIVVPTLPQEIPGYTEVDPATGLHMTGTPQVVHFADYRLKVSGQVEKELALSCDELRSLPKVTATPTLVCPGFFEDTATWSGVPLHIILEMAKPLPDATYIRMTSADGYSILLDLDSALLPENFLAYEFEGEPLPVLHGFPLRAVIPGRTGGVWVKWLIEIEVE